MKLLPLTPTASLYKDLVQRHMINVLVFLCLWEFGKAEAFNNTSLTFYDQLRSISANSTNHFDARTSPDSNVIDVTVGPNEDDGSVESIRLCHLASILPLTDGYGKPQPQEGLYSTGAALLALLHFNEKNDVVVSELQNNLSIRDCNVKLTMEFQDSQYSPIAANRVLLEDVLGRHHSLKTPLPCALIGAFRSAVTGPLSVMSTVTGIPVISAVSTSSQLDNKSVHGLLARTTPNDAGIAHAAVLYLRDVLHVTHCGVLFVRDAFGTSYQSDFTRAAFSLDPPMEVLSVPFDTGGDQTIESIRAAVDQLAATGYNYFFGITPSPSHDDVVRLGFEGGIIGPGKFWIFADGAAKLLSDGFAYSAKSQAELALASSGVGMVEMDIGRNEAFEEAWSVWKKDKELKDYFLSKLPQGGNLKSLAFATPTPWEYLTYDASMALAIAACHSSEQHFSGTSLYQSLKNVSFEGASGFVSFDNVTGTRDAQHTPYKMTIINTNPVNDKDQITFTKTVVGRLVASTEQQSNGENRTQRKWIKLTDTVYADSKTTPPAVLPPVHEEPNLIVPGIRIAGLSLAACIMILSLICSVWTIIYRNNRVVRQSQKESLLLLCVGAFIMACTVIPMSMQEPMNLSRLDAACASIPWLFQLGFVASFSALASKTSICKTMFERVQKVIRTRSDRRKKAGIVKTILPFVVISTVNISLLIAWTVISPRQWRREPTDATDVYGRSVESYGQCSSSSDEKFVFLFLLLDSSLLITATILYYQARHVATLYNENFYMLISLTTILQAFIVGVPSLLIAKTPGSRFLTGSVVVTVIGAANLLPMFLPKEWARKYEAGNSLRRSSIQERRMKLQATWDGIVEQSEDHVSQSRSPDFFSSCIYQASQAGNGPVDDGPSSGSENYSECAWPQGLDDLAL